jgi:hypothetical protein
MGFLLYYFWIIGKSTFDRMIFLNLFLILISLFLLFSAN